MAYDIRPKHYPINVYFIQKVSLARALYRSSELSLLDDPLCSLDQTVQRLVFEKALGRESILAGKTRLLVTQNKELIQKCDWVVQMERKRPVFYCFKLAVYYNVNIINGKKLFIPDLFIYLHTIRCFKRTLCAGRDIHRSMPFPPMMLNLNHINSLILTIMKYPKQLMVETWKK